MEEKKEGKKKEGYVSARTSSCPREHENTVYPHGDSHPMASSEEDNAKKDAREAVIPFYNNSLSQKMGMGNMFALSFHRGKSGSYTLGPDGKKQ
jgi:hypothetical protein